MIPSLFFFFSPTKKIKGFSISNNDRNKFRREAKSEELRKMYFVEINRPTGFAIQGVYTRKDKARRELESVSRSRKSDGWKRVLY